MPECGKRGKFPKGAMTSEAPYVLTSQEVRSEQTTSVSRAPEFPARFPAKGERFYTFRETGSTHEKAALPAASWDGRELGWG
jgi:hypothetical protein